MEKGTLYQIRNLINRCDVSSSCKKHMNANEDYFQLVVSGHTLAAAMELLGMSSVNDTPTSALISPDVWMLDDSQRKSKIIAIARKLVDKYFHLSAHFSPSGKSKPVDAVYSYACETLSLGLLYSEFTDAIKEGDGDRVLRVWKYLLLLFKASQQKNYAIEAFTILAQYHFILPPVLAEQLKWSRFINVHGLPAHNISCDLQMEHLNRLAKTAIEGLGANKFETAIMRVGKNIGTVDSAMENFDNEHHVPSISGSHSKKSSEKDLLKIVQLLQAERVMKIIPRRKHNSFKKLKPNLIQTLKEDKLKEWIIDCLNMMTC